MNRTIVVKTNPVIQNVIMIVSSMYCQFEAIGVPFDVAVTVAEI